MTVSPRTGVTGLTPQNEESIPAAPTTDIEEHPSITAPTDLISPQLPKVDEHVSELIQDLKLDDEKVSRDSQPTEDDFDENGEPKFPLEHLVRLDEMVNKPKWIIPVLPKAELEVLLDASINLARKGNCHY